jgi:hypothetical protein
MKFPKIDIKKIKTLLHIKSSKNRRTAFAVFAFLLVSISISFAFFQKKADAAWPPARKASGLESGMTT